MFNHICVGTNDLARAAAFYDATLGTLGIAPGVRDAVRHRMIYLSPTGALLVNQPLDGAPATAGNGATIAFAAASPAQADAWHAAGLAHGGTTCEDPPGERPGLGVYLAYLRDPDGNKLCAIHRLPA